MWYVLISPEQAELIAFVRSGDMLELLLQCIVQEHSPNDTGIVYCMTKKECEYTADYLRDHNVRQITYLDDMPCPDDNVFRYLLITIMRDSPKVIVKWSKAPG